MPKPESIVQFPVKGIVPNRFGPSVNPPISPADLLALRSSIERDGIRVPLVVWLRKRDRVVVSGNNRLSIARELKMATVPAVVRTFEGETQARLFAITDNVARRHMTTAQKAELALELQRLLTVGQGKRTDLTEPSSISKKVDSWALAAKLSGVGLGTISDMRLVIEHGGNGTHARITPISGCLRSSTEMTRAEDFVPRSHPRASRHATTASWPSPCQNPRASPRTRPRAFQARPRESLRFKLGASRQQ